MCALVKALLGALSLSAGTGGDRRQLMHFAVPEAARKVTEIIVGQYAAHVSELSVKGPMMALEK